jgi:hypothetical protein
MPRFLPTFALSPSHHRPAFALFISHYRPASPHQHAGEALTLYAKMQANNINPSRATYHALFQAFASNADLDFASALDVHKRMTKIVPEIKPGFYMLSTLVKMCNTHQQYESLLSFFADTQKAGHTPSFECTKMAMDACDVLVELDVSAGFHRQYKAQLQAYAEKNYPEEAGVLPLTA